MSNEIRYYTDGEQATASTLNRPLGDLNKQGQYISKSEFESMAEMRRNTFAGSGFVEWGRVYGNDVINEGMWTDASPQLESRNLLLMGRHKGTGTGPDYPIVNLEGSLLKLKNISRADFADDGLTNKIHFPEAPTSLGTITDSTSLGFDVKQGDFAILDDLNREMLNDNSLESNDVLSSRTRLNYTLENNEVTYSSDGTDYFQFGYFGIKGLIVGIEYEISINVISNDNDIGWGFHDNVSYLPGYGFSEKHPLGINKLRFVARNKSLKLYFNFLTGDDTSTVTMRDFTIKQVKEQPIVSLKDNVSGIDLYDNRDFFRVVNSISRQDLVFLETWHENVADKDIVYPYGNIQYRGGNTDGLSNIGEGTFAGKETYSLFGNWQSENDLVGLGYKWSDLSNEDKLKFAENKDNNIYKDGDNIIQVRYRVRVVKGLGNEWENTDTTVDRMLSYNNTYGAYGRVTVKANSLVPYYGYDLYGGDYNTYRDRSIDADNEYIGTFLEQYGNNDTARALPIALVQRRNDGAFDPVYNPEGSGTFTDGKEWFETSDSHNNLTDCFNNKANGYIGTVSGRPDRLFVDEINERDVEDLRMSALNKGNGQEIIRDYINKTIIGEYRGKEKSIKQNYLTVDTSLDLRGTSPNIEYSRNSLVNGQYSTRLFLKGIRSALTGLEYRHYYRDEYGFFGYIYGDSGKLYDIVAIEAFSNDYIVYINPKYGDIRDDFVPKDLDSANYSKPVYKAPSFTINNNYRMEAADIIGDPRKLSDRVKYTVVDGTSQTVNLLKNDYVLNDDEHIYRALVSRDSIDLDTDDYTNTSNWIDLGTDGSIGGYPQEWLDDGVLGIPNITSDYEESSLPIDKYDIDGRVVVKLTKKFTSIQGVYVLSKDGTPYKFYADAEHDSTMNFGYGSNPTYNNIYINIDETFSDLGYSSAQEMLDLMEVQVFYNAYSNYGKYTSSLDIKHLHNKVTAIQNHYGTNGNILQQSLICKINTRSYVDSIYGYMPSSILVDSSFQNIFISVDRETYKPRHDEIKLYNYKTPDVKFFNYIGEVSHKLSLVYVFKELYYDEETGLWGDDLLFDISMRGSKEDDNGNYVLYGQKYIQLPYFIKD